MFCLNNKRSVTTNNMKCKYCHKNIKIKYPSDLKGRKYCSLKCSYKVFSKFYRHSKKTKKKIGLKSVGRTSGMKGKKLSDTARHKLSQCAIKRFSIKENHPWFGRHHTEKAKLRISQKTKGKIISERQKEGQRKRMLKLWSDPSWAKKTRKAINVALNYKQNKTEIKLENILDEILLKEYKYVGDGQFFLGGHCPDFLNVNGKKKLIELYGDYWHRNDNPQDRIDFFKKYGFDTLVLWESELKDISKIKNKILEFNYI